MGGRGSFEGSGGVGEGKGGEGTQRVVAKQLLYGQQGQGSGPNGWLFWPDMRGMSAEEVSWRDELGLREHVFERVGEPEVGLGVESSEFAEESFTIISRCFNCGSPEHTVRTCPEPQNRPLIDLSRALFHFHRELLSESILSGSRDETELSRAHVIEEWKLQRLCWLQDFSPGIIRGETLRSALHLEDRDPGDNAPWLHNMLEWGYPPGWAAKEDPRESMLKRIVSGNADRTGDDATAHDSDEDEGGNLKFMIFGEGDEKEIIDLQRPDSVSQGSVAGSAGATPNSTEIMPDGSSLDPDIGFDSREASLEVEVDQPTIRRWATYQTSLFSSALLPIYTGRPLPPLGDDVSTTTTALPIIPSKKENGIVVDCEPSSNNKPDIEHPWRHPDAFSAFGPVEWGKRYERLLTRRAQTQARTDREPVLNVKDNCAPHQVPVQDGYNKGTGSHSPARVEEEVVDDASDDDMDLSD